MSGQSSQTRRITILDHRLNRSPNDKEKYAFKLEANTECSDIAVYLAQKIGGHDFIITFPDRTPIDPSNFGSIQNNAVLWLLNGFDQELQTTVGTEVNVPPHHHTITKSGMYEYYDSRGIDSLVISLAELIDNSLAATKHNKDCRHIEIRYYDNGADSMVLIIDNGHGMDFNGLRDWARFKYSKFERQNNPQSTDLDESGPSQQDSGNFSFSSSDLPLRPRSSQSQSQIPDPKDRRPRYLDSDINYFGAGGKQAIFNIGTSTTMISKTEKSGDMVELTLSTEKFEKKAKEDLDTVYKDMIYTRSKGVKRETSFDAPSSEHILNQVISQMQKFYKSFTICAIRNVFEKHGPKFKQNNENNEYWTKGLARIYHYYLHGPKGNLDVETGKKPPLPEDLKNMNIVIKVYGVHSRQPLEIVRKYAITLKDIEDDFETVLVRTAVSSLEFEVELLSKPGVVIEGVVRYYPFLYDKETLPALNPNEELGETASHASARTGATENTVEDLTNIEKSKHREAFECFWHGRLIPQDLIDFNWSKFDPKNNNIKGLEDCYNRLSGALFTNHAFEVSQNKQSFMDLNKLLSKERPTFYLLDEKGHRVRANFEKEFINWIKKCHNSFDKQVLYMDYQGDVSRDDVPMLKKRSLSISETYSVFNAINWRDRVWKKEDYIKTQNTKPAKLIGKISRFLVPKCTRDVSGNYMGSPGYVEIYLTPERQYGGGEDAVKIIIFKQINTDITTDQLDQDYYDQCDKLPEKVEITFPGWDGIKDGDQIIAGTPIGPMKVIVKNYQGVRLKSNWIPYKHNKKKIFIQTDVVIDDGRTPTEDEDSEDVVPDVVELAYDIAPFIQEHDYYLLSKPEGIRKVGKYKLKSGVVISSADKNKKGTDSWDKVMFFANGDHLPQAEPIKFTVIAGPPNNFTIVNTQVKALIGKPFSLTLQFTDAFGNVAKPDVSVGLPQLSVNERFKAEYKDFEICEDRALITDIVIYGPITENLNPVLKVFMPQMDKRQEIPVNLQKGVPFQMRLFSTKLEFINGVKPELGLLLFDRGNNEVTFDSQYPVYYKIIDSSTKTVVFPEHQLVENMHNQKRALTIENEIVVRGTDTPFNQRKFLIWFYMKRPFDVKLEKELVLKKNSKPSYIRLFFTNPDTENRETIEIPMLSKREFPANSQLTGVHFRAFDCDDSPIDLSEFKDQTVTINWLSKPFIITENGDLPVIHIHTDTSEERLMTFNWKQIRRDINIDFHFYLRPYADSPNRLVIISDSHDRIFPMGVAVNQSFQISVFDAHNNPIRSDHILKQLVIKPLTPKLIVDEKSLKKRIPLIEPNGPQTKISFVVSNIKLLPNPSLTEIDSTVGETRLEFSIKGRNEPIFDMIDIKVVNGPPASIELLFPHKCLILMNNRKLEIRSQVSDEYKNPIIGDKLDVSLVLGTDFVQKQLNSQTDETGIASFSEQININPMTKTPMNCVIPEELSQEFQRCVKRCFGFRKIQAIAKFKQKVIKSEFLWLHITCDDQNPVRIDYRLHGKTQIITRSKEMPTLTVHLFAEDKSLIYGFDENKIEMRLINAKDKTFQAFLPLPPFGKETFKFRVDEAPVPNNYNIKFICYGLTTLERNVEESLCVLPDDPIKLAVRSAPLNNFIGVSNVGEQRKILETPLILDIIDKNGFSISENISERDLETKPLYSGTLYAKVVPNFGDFDERAAIPRLEGCDRDMLRRFPIRKGRVVIREDELKLEEYCEGNTNSHYIVELRAYFRNEVLDRKYRIEPFHIKIVFCNDTRRQLELNQIQTNISICQTQREEIQKELDDKKQELTEQERRYTSIRNKEKSLIGDINKYNELSDLSDSHKIQNKIKEYEQKFDGLRAKGSEHSFRGQQTQSAPQIDGVIGKVANLVFIKDEDYAKSISWFLRNHMNTVVIENTQIAQQLRDEHGIESTLALDMIDVELLPPLFAPPPHSMDGSKFRVHYTVGYIRTMPTIIEDPQRPKRLEIVFTSLLGNTLYTPDLAKAKLYRQNLHRLGKLCPTIVTKEGILYENGIIEMVPREDNFVFFQFPPDREYKRVEFVLRFLKELLPVFNKRVDEFKKTEQIEKEFNELNETKGREINDLNQSINEGNEQFSQLSETPIEDLLNEDSNHSHRSYDRSPELHNRRRSYEGWSLTPRRRSRSSSREEGYPGAAKRTRY